MKSSHNASVSAAQTAWLPRRPLVYGYCLTAFVVLLSLGAALILPNGTQLSLLGDGLQVGLTGLFTVLAFQNMIRSEGQVRAFWFLLFTGAAMWLANLLIWSTHEVWFHQPVPDVPVADIFLFVGLVPLVVSTALEPERANESRFRSFGLLNTIQRTAIDGCSPLRRISVPPQPISRSSAWAPRQSTLSGPPSAAARRSGSIGAL